MYGFAFFLAFVGISPAIPDNGHGRTRFYAARRQDRKTCWCLSSSRV